MCDAFNAKILSFNKILWESIKNIQNENYDFKNAFLKIWSQNKFKKKDFLRVGPQKYHQKLIFSA
jgi:hypothetical protein